MKASVFLLITFIKHSLSDCIIKYDWNKHQESVLSKIESQNFLFENSTYDLDSLELYDFIVVGAGAAGSTLVSTLLQNIPHLKILLLEAYTAVDDEIICKFNMMNPLYDTKFFHLYKTIEQKNAFNRRLTIPVGRGLGGSSLVNYMLWMRGDASDYNLWSEIADDKTWTYENLLPVFKRFESYLKPASNGCRPDSFVSCERGSKGDIFVSNQFTNNAGSYEYIKASEKAGYAYNCDHNSFSMNGVSYAQMNFKPKNMSNLNYEGTRQDTFSRLLGKFVGNKNFDILTEARVLNISLDLTNQIEYIVFKKDDKLYKVKAKYEIIISAGAIETPAILMRSGIGNCNELKKLGIKCLVNLDGVGSNLQGHSYIGSTHPLANKKKLYEYFAVHAVNGKIKIRNQTLPKFNIITSPSVYGNISSGTTHLDVILNILHETSRGTVTLNPLDIDNDPVVNLNILSNKNDYQQFVDGLNAFHKYKSKLQFTKMLEVQNLFLDPLEIKQYITTAVQRNGDVSGTCAMGIEVDPKAVVDSKLRVFNIKGLRIADASIMPEITSSGTHVPSIAIGAKCAEFLLAKHF